MWLNSVWLLIVKPLPWPSPREIHGALGPMSGGPIMVVLDVASRNGVLECVLAVAGGTTFTWR